MFDKFWAVFSLLMVIAFLGTIIYFVTDIDLVVVVAIVVVMVIYDFWRSFARDDGNPSS